MKIDKSFVICFLVLLCIFAGALFPSLTIIFVIVSGILAFVLSNFKSKNICSCIMVLLCLQNFAIGCGAHLGGNMSSSLKLLTQIPFMTIAIVWFFSIIVSKKHKLDIGFIIYVLAIILSFFIGRGSFDVILISLRNLLVFYMVYSIGKEYIKNKDDMDEFYNFTMKLSLFMLISGIILLIGWYKIYNIIGINEVYIAKGNAPLSGDMNARFYTDIFNILFKRMGSLYYEPVNLAYFYAATFIFSLYYKKKDKKNVEIKNVLINGIGLVMCFGKGGYLVAALTIIIVFITKFLKRLLQRIRLNSTLKLVIVVSIAFLSVFLVKYYNTIGGSVKPHFWGLIKTYDSIIAKPIGYGLGTGGNMAALLNNTNEEWLTSGGESGIMTIMYQLGVQGIIAFAICFLGTSKRITKLDNKFFLACKVLPFVLMFISLLQENTYTPQCITLFMLIIGAANNLCLVEEGD